MIFNNIAQSSYSAKIDELLKLTCEKKGSDLHIISGLEPFIRINGDMVRQDYPVIKNEDAAKMLYDLTNEEQRANFERDLELDFGFSVPGVARFRGNAILQRGSISIAFRAIPFDIPELGSLGLPSDIKRLCALPRGLVLVTGPTGSGKSTTLAAMIQYINENFSNNIITIEDPIEFMHEHKKSTVLQREVGADTHSFANALRTALRHDPDIILVGEMRDPESIEIAVTAAETGHLVFSTLHTQTAPLSISRIIDSVPEGMKGQMRQQLSNCLRAVISQQLVPTMNGKDRVAAIEYMVDTPSVRNLIREEKEHQLYAAMQTGQQYGMQTMDMALVRLVRSQIISKAAAVEFCVDEKEIRRAMGTMGY